MAIEWNDNIVLANLEDEPALSDELNMLAEKIEDGGRAAHAVLDFRGVQYINSSNIAQLLRLRNVVADKGCQMRLCGVGEDIWSVLMVTGLDKVFQFSPDTLTALASLQLESVGGAFEDDDEDQES